MCEYCVKHGAGKKWFENARNFSRDLYNEQYIQEFVESYFSKPIEDAIKAFSERKKALNDPISLGNMKNQLEGRYTGFLHHQIVTIEELADIYRLANILTDEKPAVARFDCICRRLAGQDDPEKHCYGIAFTSDILRRFPTYLGGVEFLDAELAIESIRQMSDQEPVVHTILCLGVPYIGLNCNCTMPVCTPYWYRTSAYKVKQAFYKSESLCIVNAEQCGGCGTCHELCPFGVPEMCNERAYISSAKCWGCGICQKNCPEGAIYFKERGNDMMLF
ncbi:MAG: 4Fe-4S binding protein [Promethearchaeota archaeon]